MDWVSILWAMIGGGALVLAFVCFLVWVRDRAAWQYFWFAAASLSLLAIGAMELLCMRATSPASFAVTQRWAHVPVAVYLVSLVWFTHTYLDAGARWFAWLVVASRALVLVINFSVPGSINFTEVTALVPFEMLGQVVQVPVGVQSPWSPFASLTVLLAVLYVVHAASIAWRRNGDRDRQRALAIGISVPLCIAIAVVLSASLYAGVLRIPYFISPAFMLVIFVMGFELSRDLLESVRLSRALRDNQARLDLASEAADLGFWEWRSEAQGLWATEHFRQLLGFAESETITFDDWLARVHRDDRPAAQLAFAEGIHQAGHFRIEYRVRMPASETRFLVAQGRAEFNQQGRPLVVRGIVQDITAQKEADSERDQARCDLAHAGRVSMLGQLASSLAHELNQPLGAILRNSEAAALLLESNSPDTLELREIIDDIQRDDRRAGAVISRLRMLLQRRTLEANLVDIHVLVDDVLSLLRTEAISRGIRLSAELDHGPLAVHGDPIHLQQVLLNLVMNGFDAAARGVADRSVHISSRLGEGGTLDMSVADSGTGVSHDEASRIFEPFYTTKPSGMGLGLSICRTIIEAHSGKIWLDDSPGGAVFRITLPVLPAVSPA